MAGKGGRTARRSSQHPAADAPAALQHGWITAAFGRHYEVAVGPPDDPATPRLTGQPRGKKSQFACGDEVELLPSAPGQAAITALRPRRNLLWRSDAFRQKLIAANLDQIVVVVATEPGFSDLLLSRCAAAAESEHIALLIVLNKTDVADKLPEARARLEVFARLGYPIIETCALDNAEALRPHLQGKRSIFVGQSGMGKSTLTNALIPEAQAATREISAALDSGKHTTTFARLYPFAGGGWLIDSPGLQAFGLAHLDPDQLVEQFVEFRPFLGKCRFRDCHHENEPGCAILAAVASGAITERRFEHYQQIRSEIITARRQAQGW